MKKILYLITQSELGGAQKYILDLVENLQNEFEIIVAFGEQGAEGELAKKLKETNAVYYTIPGLRRPISLAYDIPALFEIIKLIKRTKPDIIHLNSSKVSILGSIAAFLSKPTIKSKIIYTVHGWVFNEPDRSGRFYKLAEKFTARFKDKFICVSEYDYQTALKEKIVGEKKLTTIHNGIDTINFLPHEEARIKLISKIPNIQYPIPEVLIGSIGNLYKTKGFEYLIDATKYLIDNGINVATIIIGHGPERKRLEDWVSQNRLDKNVYLAGRIEEAAKLLPAFDIYVCSSVKEGLSYTIIEAMQSGLPIVATAVGGNPELIEDSKTGLLVEPGNAEKLANTIMKLLGDYKLQQEFSSKTRKKALDEFSLEKMVEKTKQVYNSQ